jgi:GntR family transcriptional regulator/MocR family aminotransferase
MIFVEKTSKMPYYVQVYRQILDSIISGKYPAGHRLPGSRMLAKEIGVGRNTVDNAYAQLAAEGYIQAQRGVGFQVLQLPDLLLGKKKSLPNVSVAPKEVPQSNIKYDLFYGSLSNQDFPLALWKKYTVDVLADERNSLINIYPGNKGDLFLREQLAAYLYDARGVNCTPEQILITPGLQGSLEVICKLLFQPGDSHAFEEPGYDKSLFIFQKHGIHTHVIELDKYGAVPESIPEDAAMKSIYVTPSHQFPMGMVMPVKRRYELLNWAVEHNTYIIEDDYDSDYSYYTNPVPALQSIDTSGRVIYLGNFSKTLSPSMRMGYLVLPLELMHRYQETMAKYNCMVPWLMQRVLAKFIESGHYRRVVRKLRTKFKKSHDLLVKEIGNMSEPVDIISQGSGLKFLLQFPDHMHRDWLIETALSHGVKVYSPERFWQRKENCPPNLLQIGFTSIELEDISPCMQLLNQIWFHPEP